MGWLIPKQGPNPSKPPQIAPKIAFFDPNFTFRFPKSHKNPGVGGWVNRFGKDIPKKTFFLAASLTEKKALICCKDISYKKQIFSSEFCYFQIFADLVHGSNVTLIFQKKSQEI